MAEPGGQVLSYRGLHDRVREVAGALITSGIEPGDRVAIWSPNTHHWVLAGLGALHAGATLVPVNTRFTGPEGLDAISRSRATALFVAGPFLGAARNALLAAAAAAAGAGTGLPAPIVQLPVESAAAPAAPPARATPRLAGRTFWPGRRGCQGQRPTNGPPPSPRQP